jgi:hypothetical protein
MDASQGVVSAMAEAIPARRGPKGGASYTADVVKARLLSPPALFRSAGAPSGHRDAEPALGGVAFLDIAVVADVVVQVVALFGAAFHVLDALGARALVGIEAGKAAVEQDVDGLGVDGKGGDTAMGA